MRGFFAWVSRNLWPFYGRVSLLFGVIDGHLQLRMQLFDRQRCLLGGFVCSVSGLQLPINRNMKRFDERRPGAFSRRNYCLIIDGNWLLCPFRPA
jgi:hypothetical protein